MFCELLLQIFRILGSGSRMDYGNGPWESSSGNSSWSGNQGGGNGAGWSGGSPGYGSNSGIAPDNFSRS